MAFAVKLFMARAVTLIQARQSPVALDMTEPRRRKSEQVSTLVFDVDFCKAQCEFSVCGHQ